MDYLDYLVRTTRPDTLNLLARYGYITYASLDAAYERMDETNWYENLLRRWTDTLRPEQLTKNERVEMFVSDDIITALEAKAIRNTYLENQYEELLRREIRMGVSTGKARASIRGEYENTAVGEDDIRTAKNVAWEKLIMTKHGKAICPFHAEKTPSFSVKNGRFHCFGCQERGDTVDFVMKAKSMNFRDAVSYLNEL